MIANSAASQTPKWETFDAVYVINLLSRTDRRRQVGAQLHSLALSQDDPRLVWIAAIKPADRGCFDNIGIRGCFMSHLECLKCACASGYRRILILEDDALITAVGAWKTAISAIYAQSWDVWYGGARFFDYRPEAGVGLCPIPSNISIGTTHCVGFQGNTIRSMRDFLELILTRPPGHPEAGPMPIDGAYTVWRRLNSDAVTLASVPPVCIQRASRSDITPGLWLDKIPVARKLTSLLRALRIPRT